MNTLAILGLPGGTEWLVIGLVALLIFGRKLPETARGLGRSVVEFKKGLKGVEDEVKQIDREVEDEVNRQALEPKPQQRLPEV